MQHYDDLAWQPWLVVAAVGAGVILVGVACQVIQLVVSIRARERHHRDLTGDTVERSHAGMVDSVTATGLEFRRSAGSLQTIDAYWSGKRHTRGCTDP